LHKHNKKYKLNFALPNKEYYKSSCKNCEKPELALKGFGFFLLIIFVKPSRQNQFTVKYFKICVDIWNAGGK
jgi:hypothetical protein